MADWNKVLERGWERGWERGFFGTRMTRMTRILKIAFGNFAVKKI
jgi:hypothetical protein